jgi:putative FmdB family regulatory protein
MPIYEYICLDCKQKVELLRPMKDADAPVTCAQCGSDHTSRMLSVFNATSGGRVVAGGGGGCSGCAGGSCSSCGH